MSLPLDINRIYCMDCLEGMKLLSSKSVDMILSDLPYGTTKTAWDSPIDLSKLWAEYRRIIKERGVIALTAQCPFDKVLAMSNPKWLRYEWIWEKSRGTGFFNARYAPLKAHENILIFYRKTPVYNPQFTEGKPYRISGARVFHARYLDRHLPRPAIVNLGSRYPRTVLQFGSECRPVHPAQKPVKLFEYLIRTYTRPGDLVMDSCMGSGTTAVACLNTGRRFVGFEIDRDFHRLGEQRVLATRKARGWPDTVKAFSGPVVSDLIGEREGHKR